MNIIKGDYGNEITRTLPDENNKYLEVLTIYCDGIVRSSCIEFQGSNDKVNDKVRYCGTLDHDIKRLTKKKLKELHLKAVDHFTKFKDYGSDEVLNKLSSYLVGKKNLQVDYPEIFKEVHESIKSIKDLPATVLQNENK